ncbi:MAG TPA: O-antigen ligase family protein, partial [Candidatus Acidoferrum sp.]|nr:O-antigen ligase family protein [Candidatus Acidoferrum sp.]
RPFATLVALYIGLAPVDYLLVNSGSGVTITRLVGLGAIGALAASITINGGNRRIPRSALAWLLAFAYMIASVVWAGDQPKSIERLMQTGLPIVILALAALSRCDRFDVRMMILAVISGGLAVSVYSVLHPPPPQPTGVQGRMWLTNGTSSVEPNGLAFALMPPLALVLAAALSPGPLGRRLPCALIAALIIAAVLLTESRGGLLAMFAMFVWFMVRSRQRIVAATFVVVAGAIAIMYGGAWQRLFSEASNNAEGAGRLPIWQVGLEAFRQHWLIGNGYGTFSDAYNQVYLFVPHAFITGWSREAHDIVIASFVELGIFGGTLVFYAWWRQFRELRAIPLGDPDAWLRVAGEAGILGVFVTALFLDILVLKPAWVLPILIVAISTLRHSEFGETEERDDALSGEHLTTVPVAG